MLHSFIPPSARPHVPFHSKLCTELNGFPRKEYQGPTQRSGKLNSAPPPREEEVYGDPGVGKDLGLTRPPVMSSALCRQFSFPDSSLLGSSCFPPIILLQRPALRSMRLVCSLKVSPLSPSSMDLLSLSKLCRMCGGGCHLHLMVGARLNISGVYGRLGQTVPAKG